MTIEITNDVTEIQTMCGKIIDDTGVKMVTIIYNDNIKEENEFGKKLYELLQTAPA